MKRTSTRLLPPLLAVVALHSISFANLPQADGDLLLGVRASADPGANKDYVLNVGPVSQFTQANVPFAVANLGNVATDLGAFSESGGVSWFSRADVFWGIVGTDVPGDPANTLYVSRARVNVANQTTAWDRRSQSAQSGTNSTFRAFISGFRLSDANAASAKGTFQTVSSANSYASFTSGGTDFGAYGGIEGNFGAGTAGSVLDLYRLAPTTQNPAGAGQIYVGSFQLNDSGALTFTPAPTTFRLSAPAYTVAENGGTIAVKVVRNGVASGADTVQFDTANGTAVAGTDYTAKNAFVVNFAPNEREVTVSVAVTDLPGAQANRVFNVALSNPSTGAIGSTASASVTITDSSPQNFGQIAFSAATYSVPSLNGQGQPNVVPVTLSRANGSDGAVSVDLTVAGGTLTAGTDYTFTSPLTVSFAAGETSKTVNIPLGQISDSKLPGTINLSLANAQGGVALGATSAATVTITATDSVDPTLKVTTKSGKVTNGDFQLAGTVSDNAGVDRVEVRVNGGTVQLANLQGAVNGTRAFTLTGLSLENGKNTITVTGFDSTGNATKTTTLKVTYVNTRPALAGSYVGLISAVGSATNDNTGLLNVAVTATGSFTGKVTIGASVVPIKGLLDNAGNAHFNVTAETTAAPTSLDISSKVKGTTVQFGALAFSVAADKATGTLTANSATVANVDANRSVFDGKTPATSVSANYLANKGSYTVAFPARSSQVGLTTAEFPQGHGSATLKLTSKGVATLKGTLADGTPVAAAAPISKDYKWPFFAKLYSKLGLISREVAFDDTQADTDLNASGVIWIRPEITNAKQYPAGWDRILTDLLGAKFAPVAGSSVLPGLGAEDLVNGNAELEFSAGKLSSTVTKTVNISPANKVTNAPADKTFKLTITTSSGLISGKFQHSDGKSTSYKGAILQKGANAGGYGYFLSTVLRGGPAGESGAVTLDPK